MALIGLWVTSVVGLASIIGGVKLWTFLQSIRLYREGTKSEWIAVPPSFLTRVGGASNVSEQLRFFRINDEVMGGKSTSQLSLGEESSLVFSGTINTNGGGFASCRTLGDEAPLGLSGKMSSALLVDATGDGQLHKVTLHTADSWSMGTPSWSHDFVATKERSTHRLALSDFVAGRQGRPMKKAVLDGAQVTGIGFSLSLYTDDGKPNTNFGDGPFRLQVHSVREVADN